MHELLRELSNDSEVIGEESIGGRVAARTFEIPSFEVPAAALASRRDFVHPVRINRTRRAIGWFPSLLVGTSQPYHSSLELDWLRLLDMTPGVASFKSQPRKISFWLGGIRRAYTPDTEVLLSDGQRLMIEVKPHDQALHPENVPLWAAIRTRLADEGIKFKLVTDDFLKAQPRNQTILYLQTFNALLPDPAISMQLSQMLADGTLEPLNVLLSGFDDPALARMTIMSLARRRRLRIDLTKPITNDMEISLVAPGWV